MAEASSAEQSRAWAQFSHEGAPSMRSPMAHARSCCSQTRATTRGLLRALLPVSTAASWCSSPWGQSRTGCSPSSRCAEPGGCPVCRAEAGASLAGVPSRGVTRPKPQIAQLSVHAGVVCVRPTALVLWRSTSCTLSHTSPVRKQIVEGDFPAMRIVDNRGGALLKYKQPPPADLSVEGIRRFVSAFLEDELTPDLKSEEPPQSNDGAVTVVVGKSFRDVVLDTTKDVLLQLYAPWCGLCGGAPARWLSMGLGPQRPSSTAARRHPLVAGWICGNAVPVTGHCKKLAPLWEELGQRFAEVKRPPRTTLPPHQMLPHAA